MAKVLFLVIIDMVYIEMYLLGVNIMNKEWKKCIRYGVTIFLVYLCIYYWEGLINIFRLILGASSPLIVGAVIAYVVNILMSFYEKYYFPKKKTGTLHKSRRVVCMIASFLTLVLIVALVIGLVVPQLISCVKVILAEFPGLFDKLIDLAEKYDLLSEDMVAKVKGIEWESKISGILKAFTTGVGNVLTLVITTVTSIFSWFVSILMSVIFAIYLLLDKEKISAQVNKLTKCYLSEKVYKKLIHVKNVFNNCFHNYIVGQCIEAVIIGVLCTLGMLILRIPYATMVGALIAFTALIPIFGAYIGAITAAFMIMTVSPVKAVIFIIFIIILQQLEGNLIYPKVVGSSVGLPGIWVLAAVTVGGGVMGIVGMLAGVPIIAGIYKLLKDDVNNRYEAQKVKKK